MCSCGVWSCLCCLSRSLLCMVRAHKAWLVYVLVVATYSALNRGGLCHSVAARGRGEKKKSRRCGAGRPPHSGHSFSTTRTCPRRLLAGANRRGDTPPVRHIEGIEVEAPFVVEIERSPCGSLGSATSSGEEHAAVTGNPPNHRPALRG